MIIYENYGFKHIRTTPLAEINATLYELSHIKTGAGLIYLDRDDDNKTFAIGFATPPENDTGVFHIIEHSVLCGSTKYPLNDPFAELLKGSLNTFLNAVTYEDRTIYPVSSRCEKDFINLVDVYMDAVLAPKMLDNPLIFKQEGWHYEYDAESGKLCYNGVVYNEMKGAYSSPDELGTECLNRTLFEGTSYGKDSGGRPSAIPTLTYEEFVATYKKHYHPTNAKIFLDGKIDLAKLLPLIDSHLSGFERGKAVSLDEIEAINAPTERKIKYEISENESENNKARVLYGYVFSDFSDGISTLTASILCDILCGSNASPLKKALIEKGLAGDVSMYTMKSRQNTLVIEIRDADENRLDEIEATIKEIIDSQVRGGIEKDKIISAMNSIEFKLRERDYGTLPTGIVFAMTVFGHWMYGALPEDALLINQTVSDTRALIDSDHFEKSLLKMTLENPHRARVIMLPDKSLSATSAREERERLDLALASMTHEEINKIVDEESSLRLWQQREPSDEEIASLPQLSLSDIPKTVNRPEADVTETDGIKVLKCPVKTNGIIYLSLFFDASDLEGEELTSLLMLAASLINFPTKNRDALSLQNDIKTNLGGIYSSLTVGTRGGKAIPYLKIGARALLSKKEDLLRLIGELLLESIIKDESEMAKIVTQSKAHIDDVMLSSGETIALSRLEAGLNEAGAISEYLLGYESYRILSEIKGNDEKVSALTRSVAELLDRLVDQKRLTVSVAGDVDEGFIKEIISIIPKKTANVIKKATPTCAGRSEFFLTPSKVAYAVLGGKSDDVEKNLGLMRVARSILSYEYLWNTVRVQNGAYGTGFVPQKDGTLSFYSYRDPSPGRSLEFYRASAEYLRSIADKGEDITKFIIGAIGEYDTLITPRTAAIISANDYFGGWTLDDEKAVRAQMLNMTAKDLYTVADIIDKILDNENVVIVGGSEHLDELTERPERIITI